MKKILILANHYNTLRIFRRELLIALKKQGNEVIVIIPECDDENKSILESYGSQVYFIEMDRRGMNPLRDIKLYNTYLSLLKQYKPDKVITYTIKCNIYGAYACKKLKIPCYANVTGLGSMFQKKGIKRSIVSLMYKYSMNKTERVFFENSGNRDDLIQDKIVKPEQCIVMPGAGVNVNDFSYQLYPTDENGLQFLFVGRIMQEKGVDELFEAIITVCQKYSDIQFTFIGWYEDNYKTKIDELIELGYVRFDGWKQDVIPYYRECHCIIHPSWHEGMSNTLLEGASCGRPLITTNIHGCKEAVEDGINGYLFEKKNVFGIVEAVEKIIHLSQEERVTMGKSGREKMIKEFNKTDVVNKTLQMIGL